MNLEIKGTVINILEKESGVSKAGKEWEKQDFVIETQDQFPRNVCFTCFGDKTSLVSNLSRGSEVNVSFNIESREYNGKYFHNINAWKVEVNESQQPKQSFKANEVDDNTGLPKSEQPDDEEENDLPF